MWNANARAPLPQHPSRMTPSHNLQCSAKQSYNPSVDANPFLIRRAPLNHDSRLHPASEAGCAAFQIHPFHPRFPLPAVADQVPKIPPCHLALLPDRARLFSRLAELLDTGLQPGAQGLGRVAEDLAHFCGNAGAVRVGVVERGEGVSDASRKPGR